jgi:hypothetical protein
MTVRPVRWPTLARTTASPWPQGTRTPNAYAARSPAVDSALIMADFNIYLYNDILIE